MLIPVGNNTIRTVFHFQISEKEAIQSAEIIKDVINRLIKSI